MAESGLVQGIFNANKVPVFSNGERELQKKRAYENHVEFLRATSAPFHLPPLTWPPDLI